MTEYLLHSKTCFRGQIDVKKFTFIWFFLPSPSPTGIMVYQGMRSVMREDGAGLDTRAAVMDSCPGPIPKATVPRITALLVVNWICALRDKKGLKGSTEEVLK